MNKEVRSITYRLYPNKEQELKMIHFLDCTRKAYNRLIEICKSFVEHHLPIPTHFDLNRMVTKIRKRDESMWGVHSNCFQSVAKRASIAFKTWAKKHKEGVGFPRFKSWKRFDSFTYNSKNYFSLTNKDEKRKKKRIRLGLIGLVKYSNPYIMKGECKTATVFRKKIGNHFEWFVNITFENDGYSKGVLNIDSFEEKK